MPLNSFFQSNPKLKSSFLPSILGAAKIAGNYYGIPMRGTQPVMLFYNKSVLSQDGLSAPKTWSELVNDAKTLKAKGVQTPIALGGKSQWPTLMWFEYLYDRVAGPSLVTDALGGPEAVWNTARQQEGAELHRAARQRRSLRPVEELGLGELRQRAVERRPRGQRRLGLRADGFVGLFDDPERWFDCNWHRSRERSGRCVRGCWEARIRGVPVSAGRQGRPRRPGRQHRELLLGAGEDALSRRPSLTS